MSGPPYNLGPFRRIIEVGWPSAWLAVRFTDVEFWILSNLQEDCDNSQPSAPPVGWANRYLTGAEIRRVLADGRQYDRAWWRRHKNAAWQELAADDLPVVSEADEDLSPQFYGPWEFSDSSIAPTQTASNIATVPQLGAEDHELHIPTGSPAGPFKAGGASLTFSIGRSQFIGTTDYCFGELGVTGGPGKVWREAGGPAVSCIERVSTYDSRIFADYGGKRFRQVGAQFVVYDGGTPQQAQRMTLLFKQDGIA